VRTFGGGGEAHHVVEIIAALSGAARFVDIFKWGMDEGEFVFEAVFVDDLALLFYRAVLGGSA